MSKVRVYELAKETGLPNKEVIRRLSELDVQAKSHSSTVEAGDAKRFRDSLGQQREAKRRAAEERARAEAEEYDLAALETPPSASKARRVLPPHLRKQEEQAEAAPAAAPAAPAAPAPGSPSGAPTGAPAGDAPPAPRRFRPPPTQAFKPDDAGAVSVGGDDRDTDTPAAREPAEPAPPASAAEQPAAAAPAKPADPQQPAPVQQPPPSDARPDPREAAMRGVVRPAPAPGQPAPQTAEPDQPAARTAPDQGVPGVPRPGTPPRPGQATRRPPAPTGPPETRRVEPNLPREGSGKRAIPPPLRPAPKDGPSRAPAPGRGGPGGRPGGGPGAGAPRPGGGAPRPGGGPPRPGGGPGGPGGPGRPGGGPGGPGKPKKGKRRKEPTLADQFEADARNRGRGPRTGPVKATVEGPVDVVSGLTVGEFAKLIGVNPTDIVRVLFGMGEMITVTQSMSDDLIELVAVEMDADVRFVTAEEQEFGPEPEDDPESLLPRAPVVTVMGHVDHGKTLLLDAIREADVVSGEAGGITQHIGAYQVTKDGRPITFIDTPGHEAFTQMRARGASVTDVAILVVAADDGVMPQTVEAINHIKAADVPIIVAVNKIDKENADPTRVRTQLTEHELVAEEFGGQTTMVNVSAKSGQGLDELLEMVLLQADVAELQANPNRDARGAVIEANLDRGRGAVATVLVQAGTLRVGDAIVAGRADGKVRAMFDDTGSPIEEAGPSRPVQVLGWTEVPDAGDEFRVTPDERTARDIAERRGARERRQELANRRTLSLDELSGAIEEGKLSTLNLIVKGDVAGSVEAVADAMNKLELPEVKVNIVHKGVGAVTESDVSLAETSQSIIIAFNVRPEAKARTLVEETGVDVRTYSIIYKAVEDIELAVKGLLAPEFEEYVTGRAEVREVFRVPRAGFVFGSYVTDGELTRNATVRVIRDGTVVASDTIASLRRFKDDVTTVATGYECGVGLADFQDVKVGDEFEVYAEREVERT